VIRRALISALSCGVMLVAGCADAGTDTKGPSGVLTVATPADADALIPPIVASLQGKQAVDLLFDMLAKPTGAIETVGDAGFAPQLASRWSWAADSLSIAFTIDSAARWHDGQPVRAHDVAFSYALYTDSAVASPHAGAFAGIDSVTARDSSTAVVWWSRRHPEQFFQVAYNLAIMPAHLLASTPRAALAQSEFARHPIGSGRYRFGAWTRGQLLVFEADTNNYRGAPGIARVIWSVTPDATAASLRVLAGEADLLEAIRLDAYAQASTTKGLTLVPYHTLDYAYLAFNFNARSAATRQLFAAQPLRAALSASLDRQAMVQNVLGELGLVALGPFTRAVPAADTTVAQIAYDTVSADHVLDSLGWTRGPDGMRARGGTPLRFEVIVPASSATRQRMATLMQAQFRARGVDMRIAAVEPAQFFARVGSGDFDAALNMWHADPSPMAVRDVWGSPRGNDVGGNFGRYRNATVDAAFDTAATTFDSARRRTLFHRAFAEIVRDVPAIWLYEPRSMALMRDRVRPTSLRADAWWSGIPDWTVDAGAPAR
jgi:peptide/nickel transport system substrate-binding protein